MWATSGPLHHRSHAYYDDSQEVVGSVITSIVVVFIAARIHEKGPELAGAQCFLKNSVAPAECTEEDANAGNIDYSSLVSAVCKLPLLLLMLPTTEKTDRNRTLLGCQMQYDMVRVQLHLADAILSRFPKFFDQNSI